MGKPGPADGKVSSKGIWKLCGYLTGGGIERRSVQNVVDLNSCLA